MARSLLFSQRMKARRIIVYTVLALALAGGIYYYCFVYKAPVKLASPPKLEKVLPKNILSAMNAAPAPGQPKTQIAGASVPGGQPGAGAPAGTTTPDNPALKITGNASDHITVAAKNTGRRAVQLTMRVGDIYESGKNHVVLLEGYDKVIPIGGTAQFDLHTAAISSSNAPDDRQYTKSAATVPKLADLIAKTQNRPEITHEALQTAIIALAENPPLDVFAKFPRLHSDPAAMGNGNFKADTADIISAMQLLADSGVNDRAAAADPQLEIEAMIDPKSHDAAMRFFGIAPEMEWTYWKHELLQGNPSTRHYALYGIARYYPDVALVMLPKWAKETRLNPIYRLSAVRALALTNRQEAIAVLRQLEQMFPPNTDLYQSADRAARYLGSHFEQPPAS